MRFARSRPRANAAARLALTFLLIAPPAALAQSPMPLGPEFRVNTYTTGAQRFPSVASDSAGNFVVVWQSFEDGSYYGVFGQRFASTGAPLGGEFQVNAFTSLLQDYPAVASDPAGNFVVVWQSLFQGGNDYEVFARRYASTGAPLAGEFRVNTYTTANKVRPAVAADSAGNFVVVWMSYFQEGFNFGIYAQRFASTGAPLGGEFRVNTYTPTDQVFPAVASDSAGNFVVAWQSYPQQDGNESGIFAQRFASTGAPLGGEFRVNTSTSGDQRQPAVAADAAGDFVISWQADTGVLGIFAQRFASTGIPLGGEFRVNTDTASLELSPAVTSDPAGNFVVVWQSGPTSPDGSGYGVFAQRFGSTGVPLGGEFRVNTYTTHNQRSPSIASDSAGQFVVAWESYLQEGGGIFGQRYGVIVPVELLGFRVE